MLCHSVILLAQLRACHLRAAGNGVCTCSLYSSKTKQ